MERLVQDAIRGLEMATQDRIVEWNIAVLPSVLGDQSALKHVFANIIGNAVKYTRPRARAQIEIGCAGEENGYVILFVRDNGVGFDMQCAHKLFGCSSGCTVRARSKAGALVWPLCGRWLAYITAAYGRRVR